MERPNRKAVGETMNREGELQKGGHIRRESRRQGRNACVNIGLGQVHSELLRSASFRKGWNSSSMLHRYERREDKLDLGVKPFRDLAGEYARGDRRDFRRVR